MPDMPNDTEKPATSEPLVPPEDQMPSMVQEVITEGLDPTDQEHRGTIRLKG